MVVILDGADEETGRQLAAEGIDTLVKSPAGPTKGAALRFARERLASDVSAADFVMVFDADMRLSKGFFRNLAIPEGAEAFQLPVRPAGVPLAGAARVEAFSLAVATRVEDLARDARGLPVRLRGKAMGLSPRAFRLAAEATRTTAEDSEATLALLSRGVRVRALAGPLAFDEPAAPGAMGAPRARWFAGHLKLAFVGLPDLLRIGLRRPIAAFVLAADLFLRPRALLLPALLVAFLASSVLLLLSPGPVPVLPVVLAGGALLFELAYLAAARRVLGFPEDVPRVSAGDLAASAAVWVGAVARALVSPGRWHRARPEITGSR